MYLEYVFLGPREYAETSYPIGGWKTLAKLAAAGEDGMSISPLRNLDKRVHMILCYSSFDEL